MDEVGRPLQAAGQGTAHRALVCDLAPQAPYHRHRVGSPQYSRGLGTGSCTPLPALTPGGPSHCPGFHREPSGHPDPPLPGRLVPAVHRGQQLLPLRGQRLLGAGVEPQQVGPGPGACALGGGWTMAASEEWQAPALQEGQAKARGNQGAVGSQPRIQRGWASLAATVGMGRGPPAL